MRNALKVLLVVALAIPTLASAAISSTKHNLTSTGPAGGAIFTDGADQCMFCHLVHDASTTKKALWARADPTAAAFSAGTTVAGTTLPATAAALGDGSKQCLSCHDGSVAVNTVASTSTTIWAATTTTSTRFTAAGNLFKLNATSLSYMASLNGQHPVGIPYPGSTVGTVSSAAAAAEYSAVKTSGCGPGVATCLNSTIANAGNATKLYGTVGAYSVECGSCHEAHKADVGGNFLNFLRVSKADTNGRCGACHIK
jgi:hypothetical protein